MKKTITLLLVLLVSAAAVAATFTEIKESAILGDRDAMYQLSKAYMERKDYDRSDYWLERAAQEGQADAKDLLDMMGGKTNLSNSKRRELAAEEKRERERLLAEGKGGNGGGTTTGDNLTFTVNGVSFTMVKVDGGKFTMGATSEQGRDAEDYEKPAHGVTLSSYYIGQTEVTQELWEAVMGSNPSRFMGAKRPVECVSMDDCQTFINKLNSMTGKNFRLPTEAEWEYAARGGNKSQHYKYSGSNTLADVAWFGDRSDSGSHDVATKRANELGIYDMSGNVYEWCSDRYGSYGSSSQTNPRGATLGSDCVLRGGGSDSVARDCRVSSRGDGYPPVGRHFTIGLRLAL